MRLPLVRAFAVVLACAALLTARAEPVTLNLKDADIQSLIGTISGITGKNFIVDPRVKGKVTVIASHPMDEKEVYEVFLSVLRIHGFAAVPSGDVIKIVPEANAKQDAIPMAGVQALPGRDQVVTLVIPMQNVQAAQLVPVLRPLVPPQGHLAAYAPTNVLIVSDRAANVERLKKIIERVDLASEEEVEVVRLNNASAAEVVRILGTLAPRPTGQEPGGEIKVVADDRTNSVIMSGERSVRLRYRTIMAHLDTPLESGGNTQVIYLRYSKATELLPVLQGVSNIYVEEQEENAPSTQQGRVDIQADETTNALVVTAPPDTLRTLREVISQLDIRRAQVLVEAAVAEISFERAAELGVSWMVNGLDGNPAVGGISNLGNGIGSAAAIFGGSTGDDDDDTPGNLGNGIINIPGLGSNIPGGATVALGGTIGTVSIAAIVRALASDGDSNILSTPTLVTLDNQEAEIVVGDNVPFVTGQFTSTGAGDGATNPFQTIERQDVGLTLKIKPQINEGNAVQLEITQEVSSLRSALQSAAVGASDITTSKRSIKTAVLAEDGQVVVLGGLVDDQTTESMDKVPVLGDIPLLGNLFKSRSTQLTKRNLMVFIRPVILRNQTDTSLVSNRKYLYMRERQLVQAEQGVQLLPDVRRPTMPTFEEIQQQQGLSPTQGQSQETAETVQQQSKKAQSESFNTFGGNEERNW